MRRGSGSLLIFYYKLNNNNIKTVKREWAPNMNLSSTANSNSKTRTRICKKGGLYARKRGVICNSPSPFKKSTTTSGDPKYQKLQVIPTVSFRSFLLIWAMSQTTKSVQKLAIHW